MEIDLAWDIIERALRDHAPTIAATLRPPVSDSDLRHLAETISRPLPDDFVASLRRHDGQDNPTRLLGLADHHHLMSAREMAEQSNLRVRALGDADETYDWMAPHKVKTIVNTRGWLQYTDSEGDGYALDLDPLPAGQIGQVIYLPIDGPTPAPEWPCYTAWLTTIAEKFDAGAFEVDDDTGIWLRS